MRPSLRAIELGLVLAVFLAAAATHWLWSVAGPDALVGGDLYNVWEEGQRVAQGHSPYARIVGQSLRENQNYPTYLPLSYLLVAFLDRFGFESFPQFLPVWRLITLACHLALGLLILVVYRRNNRPVAGLVALTLVLLGRWSEYIIEVQQLDFAAILPLLLAGLLLRRRPVVSALLFGLSLSLKHLGILLLPCFLVELARLSASAAPTARHPMGSLLRYSLLALGLPALLSMPFLLQAADGFLLSMVFSLSREAADHGVATGSPLLLASADGSRVLLLALLVLSLLAQAKERLGFWVANTAIMLLFLQFSPVVFGQYFIWALSVGLIAVAEHGVQANDAGNARFRRIRYMQRGDGERGSTGL